MSRFRFCLAALAFLSLLSCDRIAERDHADADPPVAAAPEFHPPPPPPTPEVPPVAILRAGEFPLWFQFTDQGPTLIETIESARYSAALIPWPHAPHVRFVLAQGEDLLLAVNLEGFVRLSPWPTHGGIGLYRVPGGEFWRPYTVGAFVLPDPAASPVALLYLNEWFVEQDVQPPSPRLWSLDASSATPRAAAMPSLDAFASEEGWNLDVLRRSGGYWYFRATKRNAVRQEIQMLRAGSLDREGERVSLSDFHNAARPEPLSAAPPALREMLAAAFAQDGSGSATVVSPDFQSYRRFAVGSEGTQMHAFFSRGGTSGEAFLLATDPEGNALHVDRNLVRHFSLPALPGGFVYTGIGMVDGTVFAAWEEQVDFSIGAAGFMVIDPPELSGRR